MSATSSSGADIRDARLEDLPGISRIYNDAVLSTTATYDYEPETIDRRVKWFQEHSAAGLPILVAEDNPGVVAGWSSLSYYHRRPGFRFTVENSVYVDPRHRGQGLGARLLGPLIERGTGLGLRSIIAAVDAENEPSLKLHRRFGFVEVGRFPQVGFKFERWLDVVYLQRFL